MRVACLAAVFTPGRKDSEASYRCSQAVLVLN
jgi:hypothetical protein